MSLAMTVAEREAFLAEPRVAVVTVADENGRGPLAVPLWYEYQPGDLTLLTWRTSRKTRLIRRAGRISVCVQSAELPYRYVTVEGPVTEIEESVTVERRWALANRYLGPKGADEYIRDTAENTPHIVAIHLRPEHWLSEDQGKRPT
jgi:PPOX class probable F420-dependent enzyme